MQLPEKQVRKPENRKCPKIITGKLYKFAKHGRRCGGVKHFAGFLAEPTFCVTHFILTPTYWRIIENDKLIFDASIFSLNNDVVVFPGHGDDTTIGEERENY